MGRGAVGLGGEEGSQQGAAGWIPEVKCTTWSEAEGLGSWRKALREGGGVPDSGQ